MIRKIASGRSGRFAVLAVFGAVVAIATPLYALGGSDEPLNKASATLMDASGNEVGSAEFKQNDGFVQVTASFDVLPAGFHGFHVHTIGNCTTGGTPPVTFGAAGGHLNPAGVTHRDHAGDMPVLLVKADGTAEASFETDRFTVDQLVDADGSAVIVHANADNYANIPPATATTGYTPVNAAVTTSTNNTGDAGARFACGVVQADNNGHDGKKGDE